jgi:hypothetical protein
VQADHASRFSEEPHSSRDSHQRILVVDKRTLQQIGRPDAYSRWSVFVKFILPLSCLHVPQYYYVFSNKDQHKISFVPEVEYGAVEDSR